MVRDDDANARECGEVILAFAAGKISWEEAAPTIVELTYSWIVTDIGRSSEFPDLAEEVYARFLWRIRRYAKNLKFAVARSPRAILWTVARNVERDVTRAHRVRRAREVQSSERIPEPVSLDPSPERQLLRKERSQRLSVALRQLEPRERAILQMWMDDEKTATIAARFGCDARAAYARISRAKKKLERILNERGSK